jgi:hypothetical protein
MTALTVYGTVTHDSTSLTTACTMVNGLGAGSGGVDSALGTATGFSESFSQGTAAAWQSLASIGPPSGNGWLWDVTTLEGQQFVTGNWAPTLRFQINSGNGNATADLYVRAYIYNPNTLKYVLIGSMLLSGQTILNGVSTTYPFANTSLAAVTFRGGDKLYMDVWPNIVTNSNGLPGAKLRINTANSATQGNNTHQLVTPGYQVAPAQTSGAVSHRSFRNGRSREHRL